MGIGRITEQHGFACAQLQDVTAPQIARSIGASITGQCLGAGGVNPTTACRIGTDGLVAPLPPVTQTLAQPYYPGVNGNAAAGDGAGVDIIFRPDRSD